LTRCFETLSASIALLVVDELLRLGFVSGPFAPLGDEFLGEVLLGCQTVVGRAL